MLSTINLDGRTVTLVDLPPSPGIRQVEFKIADRVATVESVFTGQTQAQKWPGADSIAGTMTWPVMVQADADEVISFLMACRGKANAFRLGDPARTKPTGYLLGSVPVVDGAVATNVAGSETLAIKGLKPSAHGVLAAGEWFELGYYLYRNLFRASADANGSAVLTIWPSLRRTPADNDALILASPRGLFRLATNDRGWSTDVTFVTSISMQIQEYR